MRCSQKILMFMGVLFVGMVLTDPAAAQWVNRYSKLADFNHHTYLEQHELPILAHGPTDPAPAPDGQTLAMAARGWIWQLDLATGKATQLTNGPAVDSRPRWSPDGKKLAIVRDNGTDTAIVVLNLENGQEQVINTPTIELDPEFSADGQSLYYTSGVGDKLSLWQHHLASGVDAQLTDLPQVERNARRLPSGNGLVYLHGDGPHRVLRERDFVAGTDDIVHAETLTYHLTADSHPRERLIVYSAPIDNAYHLWTMDLDDPRVTHRLTNGDPYALTPAFSADGENVYYVEADEARQFQLRRIATHGGEPQTINVREWEGRSPTGTLALEVTDASKQPVTARVSITREDGHPVAFHRDATYFDPQTGRYYFYVEGNAEFALPAGRYTALIARLDGVAAGKTRAYNGTVTLPEGGWIAARAYASSRSDDAWPTMHTRPFAHSSPIWIGAVGSTDPQARSQSAADLMRAIEAAQSEAREAYGEVPTPRLHARFDEARVVLREMMVESSGQ